MGSPAPDEIDWNRLDKFKFYVYGAGMFSGVTTALYPLSVIKTRQMASVDVPGNFQGSARTAAQIWKADGIGGFYRGFSTIILGTIPARVVYLTVLEVVKSGAGSVLQRYQKALGLSDTALAGSTNLVAGGTASLCTQAIMVPVDVVSSRLIMQGQQQQQQAATGGAAAARSGGASTSGSGSGTAVSGGRAPAMAARSVEASGSRAGFHSGAAAARMNGLSMAQHILRREGLRGLYRGFGMSVLTYTPTSAIWWSAYGTYQKLLWSWVDSAHASGSAGRRAEHPQQQVAGVLVASGVLAGCTSATLTNPADVLKTRLQVAGAQLGRERAMLLQQVTLLLKQDGPQGLFRGVFPRMASSALWGTCMVSTYEFLKRICTKPLTPA